jgi:hypothetical protein
VRLGRLNSVRPGRFANVSSSGGSPYLRSFCLVSDRADPRWVLAA